MCSKIPAEGVDLMKQLLCYDPASRMTPEQALNHPYFESLDKSKYASRDY